MSRLRAHGVEANLPAGFEGRIYRRTPAPGETAYTVCQFATFALQSGAGDFGNGFVGSMTPDDVFVVLFEYGPESVGRRLFAAQRMPRPLTAGAFVPSVLRRALPGQSGTQWFFTESGRPFSFYAVLGSQALGAQLVPLVNQLLSSLTLSPATPATPVPAALWN